MNHLPRIFQSVALLTAISFGGCREPDVSATDDKSAPAAAELVNLQSSETPKQAAAKARALVVAEEVETFQPPFARRTDLFQRPDATKAAGIVRKRREECGGDVQLKGFVHVDQPCAMLQIDGKLWIAAAGDEKNDLTVAEVSPPSVSLVRAGTPLRLSLHEGG